MEEMFVKFTKGEDSKFFTKNTPYRVVGHIPLYLYTVIDNEGTERSILMGTFCHYIKTDGWEFCDPI